MSGSPKYTSYTLSYDYEVALAAERARLAQQEAARRAAEEERRRQARVAAAKTKTSRAASKTQVKISSLTSSELARFLDASATDMARQLAELDEQVAGCGDEKALADLRAGVDRIDAQLATLQARARAAKLAADLDDESAIAAGLEGVFNSVAPELAQRFDAAGAQACRSGLRKLKDAIAGQDLARVRQLSRQASQVVDQHVETVNERHADWQGRRDQALVAIGAAADRVAAAQTDEVCARWVGAELLALVGRLQPLGETAQGDNPERVHADCQTALAELDSLMARAQQLQLDEERRQVMVRGLIETMDRMSFTLQKDYPANDDPADPTSVIRIRVRRGADRSTIGVSIGIDGEVTYEIDGFARRVERASDGTDAATCDEAEEQIEAFHRMLEKEFGVQADELRWVGKNPNRILRTAKHMPSSNPARRGVGA